MAKKKGKKFGLLRARIGWALLLLLAPVALVLSLASKGGLYGKEYDEAFDRWCDDNGCSVRKRVCTGVSAVENYGRVSCPDYAELVEHALFCTDLEEFVGRSRERRLWAWGQEDKALRELLAKEDRTAEDTLLIRRAVIRKGWYDRLLDETVPDSVRIAVALSAERAWADVDSISSQKGLMIRYRVRGKDGGESDFVFLSPADTLELTLEKVSER